MSETEILIARLKAAAKSCNLAETTISARVLGSGHTLAALQSGKTITLAKYERAMAALDAIEGEAA